MNQGRSQEELEASAEACAWSGAGLILTLIVVLICGMCGAGEGNLRIKSERVDGIETVRGWGTGVTHGEYIVTAAHNLEGTATMYAQQGDEWIECKVIIADVDFDVAILKPSKPVKGAPVRTGISGWRLKHPYQEYPIVIHGSRTFTTPVAYGELHGVSGAGLFLDGKCLGILSMQTLDNQTGRVFCTYCPMFVIEYLIARTTDK